MNPLFGQEWWILASLSNDDGDSDSNEKEKKNKRFRFAKQQLCACINLFCTFLCRSCTTTTWKCLISRFVEGVNSRRLFFCFPELWYSLLEFNSRKICQLFMNWMSCNWDKRDKVWSSANSLFKWHFRNRRRRCCLSSLLASFFFAFLLALTSSRSKQLEKIRTLANVQPSWLHSWSKTLISFLSIFFLTSFFLFGSVVSTADGFSEYVGRVRRHGLWDSCSFYNVDSRDLLEENDEETGD